MNITNIKTDLVVYHDAKDVAIALKSRNIGALGAGLSALLAALLPIAQPLGAKYGITVDDITMGYVRSLLLGLAGLCLTPHLKSGPAVAVVTGDGAPGGSPAREQGPLDSPVGGEPAQRAAPDQMRVGPASDDPTASDVPGG